MDTKPQSTAARSYEEYQPITDWVQEEKAETVRLQLPGFQKEQLKVQLDNFGYLKISGERPSKEVSTNKWVRFRKDFRVPNNTNFNEIRAKFEKETLIVTMPKNKEMLTPAPSGNAQQDEPKTRDQEKKSDNGRSGLMSGLRQKGPVVVRYTVILMVGVAIGVYVASKFKTYLNMETD